MTPSRLRTTSVRRLLLAAAAASAFAGCSSFNSGDWKQAAGGDAKAKGAAAGPVGTPKLEIAGQNLGDSQEVSVAPEAMLQNVAQLIEAKRFTSASRWVARHPEAALETLRRSGDVKAPAASWDLIVRVQDRQTALDGGWGRLFARRRSAPAAFAPYDAARIRFLNLLSQGDAAGAAALDLPTLASQTGEPMLSIDAWQLQGTAALLNERPADAAAAWDRALEVSRRASLHQTAYLLLLQSDARRRAGDGPGAVATWLEAVAASTALLDPARPCCDPVLWERLAYLRPVEVGWPEPMVRRFAEVDPLPGLELAPLPEQAETLLWNGVGRWYLDRGHHQAALVAFKRAESSTTVRDAQHFLRFRQARALVLVDQIGAATAVLAALSADKSSPAALPATALLGSLRLHNGHAPQGLNLLRKAVGKVDGPDWAERGEAEADLGLAYLMMGDEANGLERLRRARDRFERRGEFESLALTLFNEAGYLTDLKKTSEAAALRQKLLALEQAP